MFFTINCTDKKSPEEKLARTYCGSCHLFPDPILLNKKPSVLLSTAKFDVLISLAVFHSSNVVLFCNEPLNVSKFTGNGIIAELLK